MPSVCTASEASSARCLPGVGATLAFLKLVDLIVGLRVPADEEREGLDITQHGESIE